LTDPEFEFHRREKSQPFCSVFPAQLTCGSHFVSLSGGQHPRRRHACIPGPAGKRPGLGPVLVRKVPDPVSVFLKIAKNIFIL
jgi:hypothetical protein